MVTEKFVNFPEENKGSHCEKNYTIIVTKSCLPCDVFHLINGSVFLIACFINPYPANKSD